MRGRFAPIISRGVRFGRGSSTASATVWNRPANVTRSPASRRRTIVNASSKRETCCSNGSPNAPELLLVPPGAEPCHDAAAGELVDCRKLSREDARLVERRAGDERAELDVLRDAGEPRERREAIPRPALRPPVAAVEQVVADPERVEPALLAGPRDRGQLTVAHDPLHLRQLEPKSHGRAQNASNAGGSVGTAVIALPDTVGVLDQQHLVDVELAPEPAARAHGRRRPHASSSASDQRELAAVRAVGEPPRLAEELEDPPAALGRPARPERCRSPPRRRPRRSPRRAREASPPTNASKTRRMPSQRGHRSSGAIVRP